MASSIPDTSTRAFAQAFADMQRDVDSLKRAQRAAQLGNSSIDDGALTIKDVYGIIRGSVGLQPDGTFAVATTNASVPPATPTVPILTAIASGLVARWDGNLVGAAKLPGDFKMIEIYVGTTNSFIPGLDNFVGTLAIGGDFPVAPLDTNVTYYVRFIAVNNAETQLGTGQRPTASPPSAVASVIPQQVVAQAVLDGIVTSVALANEAVTQAKIALQAVGTGQIAGNAVDLSKLANNSVDASKLVDNSVTTPKIVNNAVQAPKIDSLAVTTPKVALLAITTPVIANQAITTPTIAPQAVTAPTLGPAAVTGPAIAASAVTANSIAANTITAAQITADTLTANEIAANAITTSELNANSVVAGKVAANAITTTTIAAGSVTANAMAANSIATSSLQADSVTATTLAANSVTSSEITANSVVAGKVAADAITANELSTNSVTSLKVSAGAITAGKVAADAITAVEIAANAVTASELNAGSVNATKVVAGTIGATELAANSVVAGKIAADAVTTTNIVAGGVQAGNIAAASISTTALAAGAVTTAKLAALAVTANEISANAINAGHIQAGAVTAAKLAATLVLGTTIIAGIQNGARVQIGSFGIEAFRSNGTTKTLDFDNATGNIIIAGQYRSGDSGERIIINVDGTQQFVTANGGSSYIENTTDGIRMRGPSSGGNAGFQEFPDTTSASLKYGSTGGGTVYSRVSIDQGKGFISAPNTDIVSNYLGSYIRFLHTNSSGGEIGNTVVRYQAADVGWFVNPVTNSGMKLTAGGLSVTTGSSSTNGPVYATNVAAPSSEVLKQNIREIAPTAEGRTSWDVIEGAPALEWEYIHEDPASLPPHPVDDEGNVVTIRERNPNIPEDEWNEMRWNDPRKWIDVPAEWAPEVLSTPARKRKGPLAEDIFAVDPSLALSGDTSNDHMYLSVNDMVGILWDATDMLIKRNRLLEQILMQRFPILANALPGRPQKGDVKAGIGAIIQGRTKRVLDLQTGQIRDRIKAALNQ